MPAASYQRHDPLKEHIMPPYVVFTWIVLVIAGALIGQRSGHRILGAFAGLLLGPIGVLVMALWKPLPKEQR